MPSGRRLDDTTVHAGYSRYLSPPPFELVGGETISKFLNTTAAPRVTVSNSPLAEQANYYDVGVQQKITRQFTRGPRHLLQAIAQLDR